MAYSVGFIRAFLRHDFTWWYSLFITYLFGVGFWQEYPLYRATINSWQGLVVMPESLPVWVIVLPFLF